MISSSVPAPAGGAARAGAGAHRNPCRPRLAGPPRLVRRPSAAAGASPSPAAAATTAGKVAVVFAIDDTEAAGQALEWAAGALCAPSPSPSSSGGGGDLRLLHVVCDARAAATSIGVTPTGRVRRDAAELADRRSPVVREHEARLVAAARRMVERRCAAAGVALPAAASSSSSFSPAGAPAGSPSSLATVDLADAAMAAAAAAPASSARFNATDVMLPVAPGAKSAAMIGAAVCRAARAAGPGAALVVPSHGPGALADFGSVARFCYQRALAASTETGGTTRAAGDCSALVLVPPASAREALASRRVALAARSARELDALAAWAAANVLREGDEVGVISVVGLVAGGVGSGVTDAAFELSASASQALQKAKAVVAGAAAAGGGGGGGGVISAGGAAWQQRVLDAAAGARALVMLEDERPGASKAGGGTPETFEEKMAALTGGAGGLTMDERDSGPARADLSGVGGGGGAAPEQQGLADYASRRSAVPLVLLGRR